MRGHSGLPQSRTQQQWPGCGIWEEGRGVGRRGEGVYEKVTIYPMKYKSITSGASTSVCTHVAGYPGYQCA